jgi:hypothetical protein
MLAGTFVYVFAGTQLATVDSVSRRAEPGAHRRPEHCWGCFRWLARKIIELACAARVTTKQGS